LLPPESENTPEETQGDEQEERRAPTFILSDRAANWVIGVVTGVWALNIIAGMVQWNGYQPSEMVNGVFMTVVGGAFMLRIRGS
jgi:hypothetical protein